jgi:BolA family transcriptional regulator, general stress-responsive regulator
MEVVMEIVMEMVMNTYATIEQKVQAALSPQLIQLENESHMHSGPRTDSHFKLVVVSEQFEGLPKVKRHRRLYQVLQAELQGGVHALALHLYTPGEWQNTAVPASPLCSKNH